jgi:hypothetical protein
MSPQRGGTTISFENKVWSEEGVTARPTLTLFKHTQGAKVRGGCDDDSPQTLSST